LRQSKAKPIKRALHQNIKQTTAKYSQ